MIQKITSQNLMNMFDESKQSISTLESNIDNIEKELSKKITIIKNIQEYSNKELLDLKELLSNGNAEKAYTTILLCDAKDKTGIYDSYGSTIHPAFLKTPYDIFNFDSVTGKIFKNNANVKINDVIKEEYNNILINDDIATKTSVFEEYSDPDIKIEIEINPGDLLGATSFNTIEILPFIPGSFNINEINIYTMQDYQNNNNSAPSLTITNNMENIEARRLLLDKSRDLWKIDFSIHINYKNSNGLYPFGLKHLYFLNTSLNPNSNIIFKISKDDYIQWISEDIIIHDQNGKYETTCTEQNIELYMNYMNGVLDYKIDTSKGLAQNIINRNIKEFWVYMPILKTIKSIQFKNVSTK